MDFKKLMQQAQANQCVIERKRERHKHQKEFEQKFERSRQFEEEKKARTRLKEFKEAAERKRLEYKGLLGTTTAHQEKLEAHGRAQQKTKDSSTVGSADNGSASCKPDKRVSHSGTKQASLQSSKLTSIQHKTKSSEPSSSSRTRSSSKMKPKAPVNFQDLMKMAQQKSSEVVEKEKLSVRESTSRESSPLGRSLLEKTNPRLRNKRTHDMMDGDEGVRSTSVDVQQGSRRSSASPKPLVNTGRGCTSQSQRGGGRVANKSSERRDKIEAPTVTGKIPNGVPRLTHTATSSGTSTKAKHTAINRTQNRPLRQQQKSNPIPQTTKSFYGAASARLLQNSRPKFSTRHAPGKYTSSWVDEMSDYMRQRVVGEDGDEGYSEEEEDLSDFVASDDEDGAEEYSSAIKQIFGYDRRKYANDDDDAAMESSYAQQMFEEQRSYRIGHQEDAEDVRREKEAIARKRRKRMGEKPNSLIQSKLKFR